MANVDIDSLEPNSHKYRAEKAANESEVKKDKEKMTPIINRDQIVSTKKPLSKKISETFLTEDTKDVKSWVLTEVIIPGIKSTILDILSMIFFGEICSRTGRRSKNGRDDDRVNYSSYYRGNSYFGRNSRRRDNRYNSDDKVDFRNIILRERADAEDLIDEMKKRIHNYGSVSVADLLDLIDVAGRYTDNDYGWDDERDIGIRRVSSGYLIDVAEPKYIK